MAGATIAVTRQVDVMLEYVHWEVHGAAGDDYVLRENGYQLVLNWRF